MSTFACSRPLNSHAYLLTIVYFFPQVSYAIGVARPLSISLFTYGTSQKTEKELLDIVHKNFDLRPGVIVRYQNREKWKYPGDHIPELISCKTARYYSVIIILLSQHIVVPCTSKETFCQTAQLRVCMSHQHGMYFKVTDVVFKLRILSDFDLIH